MKDGKGNWLEIQLRIIVKSGMCVYSWAIAEVIKFVKQSSEVTQKFPMIV